MLTAILSTLVQQIMPRFVTQRALYEVRERPSKAYSWAAFIIANIFVEIPYQIFLGILVFAGYYYPTYRATDNLRIGLPVVSMAPHDLLNVGFISPFEAGILATQHLGILS